MNIFITTKKKIKYIMISIIVISIILFLSFARVHSEISIKHYTLKSYAIYMIMLGLWFYSIRSRIIEKDIRYYIYYICFLMMFLITVRTIKWSIYNVQLAKFLWYLYYIPFILIPLLLTFIAIYIDKNLYQKLIRKLHFLFIGSLILILFVLTNDWHQQVFKIVIWSSKYDKIHYMWGYYLVFIYIGLISLNTMYFIIKNSNLPNTNKRIILPIFIMIFQIIYIIFYIKSQSKFGLAAVEVVVMVGIVIVTIIESLILTGLIPSNSNYEEIFKNLDIPLIITDNDYNICFKSKSNLKLNKEIYSKITDESTLVIDDNKFSIKDINKGHILWTDDITSINQKTAEINAINKDLLIKNELLREQVLLEKEELTLKQQNIIYEHIENSTRYKINKINRIIKNNDNISRENLIEICLIGSYIKRVSNIILIGELYGKVNIFELQNAILESVSNYKLKNSVNCSDEYIDTISIKGYIIKKVYRYFETELEFYFYKNASLDVYWTLEDDNFNLSIKFSKNDIVISNNILDFKDFFSKNHVVYKETMGNNFYKIDLFIQGENNV